MFIMEEILRDHSDSAITIASEENFMIFVYREGQIIPKLNSPSFYKEKDMMRACTGLPDPYLNRVICPRFGERNAEQQVSRTIDFFKTRNLPHAWWIGASSTPDWIGEILVEKGLVKSEWDWPTMAADLRTLDESKLLEIANRSGVVLNQVETKSDLDIWINLLSEIYTELSTYTAEAFRQIFRIRLAEGKTSAAKNFMAMIDDEPVGMSSIYFGAGVAGLYAIGTLTEYQRRGIGAAVTLKALLYGIKRGYEISVLQSTKAGFNMYNRLGFKEYFKWKTYYWLPDLG